MVKSGWEQDRLVYNHYLTVGMLANNNTRGMTEACCLTKALKEIQGAHAV